MTTPLHRCFLFNEIPGTHPRWTVAVMAMTITDARQHVKTTWGGGKFVIEAHPGKVTADCGSTTEAAQLAIRAQNERNYRGQE